VVNFLPNTTRAGLDPKEIHVVFLVDRVTLGQV